MMVRFEIVLAACCIALALLRPGSGLRLSGLCRLYRDLASRRGLAVAAVGGLAFALAALTSILSWPEPRVHDEFSYLLGADTFSHGRLTNPLHPLAVFFETFHVNQWPTYCSIYPPGQALFLAAGQVLCGHALAGVWLSFALGCAGVCWALQAWVPPRWALTGALLTVLRIGFIGGDGYWSQSYWGGSVAMLGGALVFGALPRIIDRARTANAFWLAVGLTVLANSRPFEGMIATLPAAVVLLLWFFGDRKAAFQAKLGRVILPITLVLTMTAWGMGHYNARLTGKPTLLPYELNAQTYSITPLFLWQPLRPEPSYRHDAIRAYHTEWAVPAYEAMRSPAGYAREIGGRLRGFFNFYAGALLGPALLGLPWIVRKPWPRFALSTCGLLALALAATAWFQPHYAAPVAVLIALLLVQGIRQLQLWRWQGLPVGRSFVAMLPWAYGLLFIGSLAMHGLGSTGSRHLRRAELLSDLQDRPGRHLVIVRYRPKHSPHEEWVFNAADIDGSQVIWARDMGDGNRTLMDYYKGRHIWILDADARPPAFREARSGDLPGPPP
jgi:hypothetical protein